MGYVGNQTSTSYTSMDKQTITGSGATAYTLSHSVSSESEIEVFVNNIRQEGGSGKAYTVSGTTITFTEAVASSDSIYVIFQGKAIQTVVPPDGSVSSAKIASGAVTSAKLDTNIAVSGDLTVDTTTLKVNSSSNLVGIGTASPTSALHVYGGAGTNIAIQSSAGTHWRIGDGVGSTNGNLVIYDYSDSRKVFEIDTLGHVTMPTQPAFFVKATSHQNNVSASGYTTVTLDDEVFDQNADFASNTFTAPITGRYLLCAGVRLDMIDTAANYVQLFITTSNRNMNIDIIDPGVLASDPSYWYLGRSIILDMDANDTAYLRLYIPNGAAQADIISAENTFFSGMLAC